MKYLLILIFYYFWLFCWPCLFQIIFKIFCAEKFKKWQKLSSATSWKFIVPNGIKDEMITLWQIFNYSLVTALKFFNLTWISFSLPFFLHIISALPSPVRNCSINNQTQHSLEIQCLPSYDGGLPQIFLLELIAMKSGKLR